MCSTSETELSRSAQPMLSPLQPGLSVDDRRERIRVAIYTQKLAHMLFRDGPMNYAEAYAECFGRPLEMRSTVRREPKSAPDCDEIAGMIAWLCSEDRAFTTGGVFNIFFGCSATAAAASLICCIDIGVASVAGVGVHAVALQAGCPATASGLRLIRLKPR